MQVFPAYSFSEHVHAIRDQLRLALELFHCVHLLNNVQIANRYLFAHWGRTFSLKTPHFLATTTEYRYSVESAFETDKAIIVFLIFAALPCFNTPR